MTDLICPKDQAAMRTVERNGVTVERCPECGGLFLDRGELERLFQAESAFAARPAIDDDRLDDDRSYERESHARHGHDDRPRGQPGQRQKKRGFLADLLDFG